MDSMKRLAAVIPQFPQGGSTGLIAVSEADAIGVHPFAVKLWTPLPPFFCKRSWLLECIGCVTS